MHSLETFLVTITQFFNGNPYLGIAVVILSTSFIPTSPPEEVITLLVGAFLATGMLHPFLAGLVTILAIISVNQIQYAFGRFGLNLLQNSRAGSFLEHSRFVQKGEALMLRHGFWAIVLCRFMFGTRTPVYIASGFLRYRYTKFLLIDSVMVVIHGVLFMLIGRIFYQQVDYVIHLCSELGIVVTIAVLVIGIGIFYFSKYILKKDKA